MAQYVFACVIAPYWSEGTEIWTESCYFSWCLWKPLSSQHQSPIAAEHYSISKYLFSTYCIPGALLGAGWWIKQSHVKLTFEGFNESMITKKKKKDLKEVCLKKEMRQTTHQLFLSDLSSFSCLSFFFSFCNLTQPTLFSHLVLLESPYFLLIPFFISSSRLLVICPWRCSRWSLRPPWSPFPVPSLSALCSFSTARRGVIGCQLEPRGRSGWWLWGFWLPTQHHCIVRSPLKRRMWLKNPRCPSRLWAQRGFSQEILLDFSPPLILTVRLCQKRAR